MPTYVYKFIDSGETVEVRQSFADDSLTEYEHPETGHLLPVKKVFQPIGVTFKGSGFFKTDNRGSSNGSTNGSSSGNSKDSKDSKSSGSSGSSGSSASSDTSSGSSSGAGSAGGGSSSGGSSSSGDSAS